MVMSAELCCSSSGCLKSAASTSSLVVFSLGRKRVRKWPMISAELQVLLAFQVMTELFHRAVKNEQFLVTGTPLELSSGQFSEMEGNRIAGGAVNHPLYYTFLNGHGVMRPEM
ncbi:hypothetical protein M513_06520 [Trichuris suis]|uniref:Uncharacterized protein n=1 Tax=Trichuris suis TaxID=68888 RepID=A0A085M627_9BILA|nr:hypothetical protein M513_06520 [Trichuris suis]